MIQDDSAGDSTLFEARNGNETGTPATDWSRQIYAPLQSANLAEASVYQTEPNPSL